MSSTDSLECSFLGKRALPVWEKNRECWAGDKVSIDCGLFTHVSYDDERNIPSKPYIDSGGGGCVIC
jgi:hypothetical protein